MVDGVPAMGGEMKEVAVAGLVSVVTPTYNRAPLLPRAVQSVLGQDYRDLELLVVDDGSTDETPRVMAGFTDPRLRYTRFETNRGSGAARSEGVAQARGELVAFLDSDDCWKPGKLARMAAALARHPEVDLAFSDYEDVNYIQDTRERGFAANEAALRGLSAAPLEDGWWIVRETGVPEALMRMNFIGTPSIVVMRRSVVERAGNFHPGINGPDDFEMWWRLALVQARFAYTTEVLVERHKDSGSITAQRRAYATRRLAALDACADAARRLGRPDLLRHVDGARRRNWCDLVEIAAREGERGEAWRAFRSGLRYGLSLEAVRYLGMALAGPRTVALARRALSRAGRADG
jgi:glycosyltransferase involved in cell wall biosynthesis